MILSYKDGQTIVQVGEEKISAAKAMLQFPKLAKTIMTYSRNAKKFSEMKVVSFKRKIHETYNKRDYDDSAEFYINDHLFQSVENATPENIEAPEQYLNASQKEKLDAIKSRAGLKKIDWVNGTYSVNGKPMTNKDYDFVQAYLNGTELDAETGKISASLEPSFAGACWKPWNGQYIFNLDENTCLCREQTHTCREYGDTDLDLTFTERVGVVKFSKCGNVVEEKNLYEISQKGAMPDFDFADCLKKANLDLVESKINSLLYYYVKQKEKTTMKDRDL